MPSPQYVIYVTHWAACILYHIAVQEQHSPQSWVGRNAGRFQGKPLFQKYVQALYFSASAFQVRASCTAGVYMGSVVKWMYLG